eukprot:3587974-Pyramimonas_sp.AAC.1
MQALFGEKKFPPFPSPELSPPPGALQIIYGSAASFMFHMVHIFPSDMLLPPCRPSQILPFANT